MKVEFIFLGVVSGHGRLIEPPGRSSYHLFPNDPTIDQSVVIPNYNDNALYCGGFSTEVANGYRCGVCGDVVTQARPRDNELGGRYGKTGLVPRTYNQADIIDITIQLTAHHKGWFSFKMCPVGPKDVTEDEACFNLDESIVPISNGNEKWDVTAKSSDTYYYNKLQLPDDLACDHCVIQWRYHTGNSWGCDTDGNCGLGLGYQEEFYGCADVRIAPRNGPRPTSGPALSQTTTLAATKFTTTATTKTLETATTKTSETATTKSAPNNEDINIFCQTQDNGLYAHPFDCSLFINCSNGYTFIQTCPPSLLYNPKKQFCDYPHNVTC